MITTIGVLGGLGLIFGLLLGYAGVRFKIGENHKIAQADKMLPQQQCKKCGYAGCRPYAEAIVKREAEINLCLPSGELGKLALAYLLDHDAKPLNGKYSEESPKALAEINELACIGCTLCVQACPVDAILGAPKYMHTVIAQECTGCELCIAPCPVNCVEMIPVPQTVSTWKWPYPEVVELEASY